jgi:polyvinyl alcohol dehydrogenase (cytochrome)
MVVSTSFGSAAAAPAKAAEPNAASVNWPMGGRDYANTRSNPAETAISPANVERLAVKWTFTSHGDVSATAAVVDGAVYVPDWGGYLTKVDARNGKPIWQTTIAGYTGLAGDVSRTSPVVDDGVVYVASLHGARLIAVSAETGALLWVTQLDTHPAAMATASPIVYDGVVYEGVSSREEYFANDPSYPCCTFRGSMTATDARTGAPLWKTYTVPDNGGQPGGYSGGAVWGSTPTLDAAHGTVYVTTGNNYSVPQSVDDCRDAGGSADECVSPDDHIDSIIAMDMRTGAIAWATGTKAFDTWNIACVTGPPPNNCPRSPGGDYDFGDGTHLFHIPGPGGTEREVVGAGSKSGTFWTLDARTGEVIWSASPGPGSYSGGIMWGSSVDGSRVYVAEANYLKGTVTLPDGTTTTGSTWAALDSATGRVLWQIADPSGGVALSPLTNANGVVYASSTSGYMYAINATTGQILWSHQGPYAVNNGPSVVNGTVYWGNGYYLRGSYSTGTLFAFSSPGD